MVHTADLKDCAPKLKLSIFWGEVGEDFVRPTINWRGDYGAVRHVVSPQIRERLIVFEVGLVRGGDQGRI